MEKPNKPYQIETTEKCSEFLAKLRERGYYLWQMQYRWDADEGFHAWFYKPGHEDIEVVTHKEQVQEAILDYNSDKW